MQAAGAPTPTPSQPDTAIPAIDQVRLVFRDPEVEAAYRGDTLDRHVRFLRVGIAVGLAVMCLYGWLDTRIVSGAALETVWLIRYTVLAPLVVAFLVLTWVPFFRQRPHIVITLVMQTVGTGVLAMMAALPSPGTSYYFSGLVIVIIFCCCVFRPHPAWAAANCLMIVAGYAAYVVLLDRTSEIWTVNNLFFLAADSVTVVFASYLMELFVRRTYARDIALQRRLATTEALRREAEHANTMKSRFLAMASHELRTPLNAIIGFSDILAHERFGPLGNDNYREYAANIHDSGEHLLALVSDLLDVSKAESGDLDMTREPVDIAPLTRKSVESVRPQAESKGLDLTVTAPAGTIPVNGDPRLLRRALMNVLANAVKFTQTGSVTVTPRWVDARTCAIDVVDTGPGIATDHHDAVFESFVQADDAYARQHGGAGLGLALVRRVAELHGGRVELDSAPDAGTRVTLLFPALAEAAEPDTRPAA